MSDPFEAAESDALDGPGPVFFAEFHSECAAVGVVACPGAIDPGDRARMVDGEAVHADCWEELSRP